MIICVLGSLFIDEDDDGPSSMIKELLSSSSRNESANFRLPNKLIVVLVVDDGNRTDGTVWECVGKELTNVDGGVDVLDVRTDGLVRRGENTLFKGWTPVESGAVRRRARSRPILG